jgi:hypothetical protein
MRKIADIILFLLIFWFLLGLNSCDSIKSSSIPSFIKVGKTYRFGNFAVEAQVLEIDNSGWIKLRIVKSENPSIDKPGTISWINLNAYSGGIDEVENKKGK